MCRRVYQAEKTRFLCDCGGPLEQQYDIERMVADGYGGERLVADAPGIWRYGRLLPAQGKPVTLNEGFTPLVPLGDTGRRLGIRLFVKDEGRNPTGSFKARGASVGVTRLSELGWKSLAMPTVGSGGSAWAAYAARAGLRMQVGLPLTPTAPRIGLIEPPIYGAEARRYDGVTEAAFVAFRAPYQRRTLTSVGCESHTGSRGRRRFSSSLRSSSGGACRTILCGQRAVRSV